MYVMAGHHRMRRIYGSVPGWEMGREGRVCRCGATRGGARQWRISFCRYVDSMGRAGTGPGGRERPPRIS